MSKKVIRSSHPPSYSNYFAIFYIASIDDPYDQLCIFCRQSEETLEHLFFRCDVTSRLWRRTREWLQMRPEMSTYRSMLRTFRRLYRKTSIASSTRHVVMAALVYHLWGARNAWVHEGQRLDEGLLFRRVQMHVYQTLGVYTDRELCQG
ncbi:uncharacterized protein LOC141845398 [Curcuma longa]|uniref:uncharacterized protein LOC141845398 n=1 Tax=Curcuma longa TaxID=136217 RepID=UPI003D9EAC6F